MGLEVGTQYILQYTRQYTLHPFTYRTVPYDLDLASTYWYAGALTYGESILDDWP